MALNPPLNEHGQPLRVANEHFILERIGISFEVKIPSMGKLKGKGSLLLTTTRIVLLNDRGGRQD